MKEVWIKGWKYPFVYYNYSELTYAEKLRAAYGACMKFYEDITRGLWQEECQNDKWYDTLLTLLKDLGYDVSSVENINWDRASEYSDFFGKIGYELGDLINKKYKNVKCRRGITLKYIII